MKKTNTNWKTVNLFRARAGKINCKKHFRLRNHGVTASDISKVRQGSHCRYNINYHFVWTPKTRMKILVEPFKSDLKKWIYQLCKEKNWQLLALEIMPNHIHFLVSAHPKWAPMWIIKFIKQETSRRLRWKYPVIRDMRKTADFWARGYYCGSIGRKQD